MNAGYAWDELGNIIQSCRKLLLPKSNFIFILTKFKSYHSHTHTPNTRYIHSKIGYDPWIQDAPRIHVHSFQKNHEHMKYIHVFTLHC